MAHLVSLADRMAEKQRLEDEARDTALSFFGPSREVKARPKATTPRPVCANCGKPYGERAERTSSKTYVVGEPIEPYRGNEILVAEQVIVGGLMGPGHKPGARVERRTWDGVSYRSRSGTDPFCTNPCALAFAQAAHAAGYRIRR